MKKILLYSICFLFAIISCSRSDEYIKGTVLETVTYIYLKDTNGKDLIGTPNYNNETIVISYLAPASQPGVSKNYVISKDLEGRNFIKIFCNYGDKNSTSAKTIVKWNDNEQDTLKADFWKIENSILIQKVYKGKDLICSDSNNMTATLIK